MMLEETFDGKVDMSMQLQSGGRAIRSPRKSDRGLNISVMTANQSTYTAAGPQTTRHASRKSVAASSYHQEAGAKKRERNRTQKPRTTLPFDLEAAYLNHEEKQKVPKIDCPHTPICFGGITPPQKVYECSDQDSFQSFSNFWRQHAE